MSGIKFKDLEIYFVIGFLVIGCFSAIKGIEIVAVGALIISVLILTGCEILIRIGKLECAIMENETA